MVTIKQIAERYIKEHESSTELRVMARVEWYKAELAMIDKLQKEVNHTKAHIQDLKDRGLENDEDWGPYIEYCQTRIDEAKGWGID